MQPAADLWRYICTKAADINGVLYESLPVPTKPKMHWINVGPIT